MTEKDVFEKAIKLYGKEKQCTIAMEEFSEAIQAVSKCLRKADEKARENLVEELADSLIMIEQLKMMFDISTLELDKMRALKVRRLSYRLASVPDDLRKVIAIDFDGCLCTDSYPDIGEPNQDVINEALREQQQGTALILWTCRGEKKLEEALAACEKWGLKFDAVNENLPERIIAYGNDCRKVSANEYWDDKSVCMKRTKEV